jgi:hypothetical protein
MGDALPTVDLGTGRTATQISAAYEATCAILDDGSVKCWGNPTQTGLPLINGLPADEGASAPPFATGDRLSPLDFGGRKATHLAVAAFVACASMEDETFWCWGAGTRHGNPELEGQSTHGEVVALSADALGLVFALFEDGSVDDVMGHHNASSLTESGRKAVAIGGALYNETCAIFDDGTSACLPSSINPPPIPMGTVALGAEPNFGWCWLDAQGAVRCSGEDAYCPLSPGGSGGIGGTIQPAWCPTADGEMPLGQPALAITSGGLSFSCALLSDAGVKCWGANGSLAASPWLGAEFGADWSSNSPDVDVPKAWPEIDLGTHR